MGKERSQGEKKWEIFILWDNLPIKFCSFNVAQAVWFTCGQKEQVSLETKQSTWRFWVLDSDQHGNRRSLANLFGTRFSDHVTKANVVLRKGRDPLTATNWSFSILMMSPTTTFCHRSSTTRPSRITNDLRLFTWLSLRCRCCKSYGDVTSTLGGTELLLVLFLLFW